MIKNIAIFGAYGLVGTTLCNILGQDYKLYKIKYDYIPENMDMMDYVIFGSGYGQPIKFGQDKIETIRINTEVVSKAFSILKPKGTFLFISTSEVYSGSTPPYKETDIGNTTPQHPRACYIEGKRCGEAICMAYKDIGYDVKIARLALAYGEGTKKGDTRVLNQFIEQAITTGHIKLLDDGSAMRTYVYVQDACEMTLDILFKGKDVVYNVGGFSEISIADLAHNIALMTGAKVTLGDKSLIGSPENVKLDMSKTLKEFPRDFVTLTDGLFNTIKYQKTLYE
jgi:nucleoside-diphosphate-sugar epimerase